MDKLRRQTFYLYDPLNRLTNTVFTDNSSARTIYDDIGRVISTVDDRGVTNAFGYDAAGRRFAVTNALGATEQMVSTFGFDSNGNETYLTNALGIVTTNVFDPLNRQVGVLYPDGTSAFFGLDASGRRVSKTNQDGVITLFAYDGAGRLTSVTNAFGTTEQMVTRYDYDEAGNLVHQIDALNRTNAFSYDALRRRISHSMPDTNLVERFGYDIAGRLLYHTNFNGMVVTNEFNEMNRLTNQMSVQGYRASYAYSPTGHRTNMTDLSGTTRYSYDARDRLTNKVVSWTQGPSLTLSYVYDTCGSLTRLWSDSSGGVTNFYEHDALGRLTNVVTRDGGGASYGFDPLGNVQTIRFRNSVTNVQWYDALSRLTNSLWKLNTNTLASFSYILAPGGTRTNLSELLNGTNYTYAWAYDRLYRLKQESLGGATSGTLSYGFDRVSNRTNRTVSGSPGLTNQTATFDSKDRLASDSYDDNGNTTSSAGNVYLYDPLNHATNVNSGSVVIEYDGDGNRVTRTTGGTTTYYLTDDRNPSGYAQTIEEWVGSPGGTNLLRVYNYGLELLSQEQLGVSTNYFILDGHGSTRALANASGAIVNTFVFDAYGNILRSNTASQTPYLYLCQRYDADVGTYHLRARTYNPNSGRFLTSDPYSGNLNDPLTLHKYLYANCDPVNGADRSGYLVEEELETEAIGEEIETDSALSVSEMEVKGLDKIGTAFLTGALLLGTALFVTGDTAEQAEPEPVPQIPDQKEFKAYQDPTLDFGVEGHCVQYAEKIDKKKRTSGRALFIAYRLKLPYNINVYSPWGSILDRIAGRNVSENGFHVGWIRKGKVYDNWYSGIPMLAWPSLYEVIRPIVGPDGNVTGPTTFATLGQAHMEGFGQLKLFKDSPPQSRYDERWNSEGGDVINMQNFEQ